MDEKICAHFFVSGKVQGVWFRVSTQDKAKELGLTGWARNLADGRVEVMACGEGNKVNELHEWLTQGPELAQVTKVIREVAPWNNFDRFGVK